MDAKFKVGELVTDHFGNICEIESVYFNSNINKYQYTIIIRFGYAEEFIHKIII